MKNSRSARRTVRVVFFVLLFLFSENAIASNYKKICGNFYIKKESWFIFNSLDFSKNEKIFICGGDVDLWSKIPKWQSKEHLKTFLQKKGYFFPKFSDDKEMVYVDPGSISKVKKVVFIDSPKGFLDKKYIGAKNKTLNSTQLNEIEGWVKSRLRRLGHACPKINIKAYPEEGHVRVTIDAGNKVYVGDIEREVVEGISPSAFSRFDAFQKGDLYNGNSLELSSRRVMNQNIVDYSHFYHKCPVEEDLVSIKQDLSFGKPRRVSLSFGASTEQFPIFKASWLHSRIDKNASLLEFKTFLSPREQSATASAHWHVFNNLPRLYFLPLIKFERNDERVFEFNQQTYSLGLGFVKDTREHTYLIESRPTFNIENTIQGVVREDREYLSLDSQIVFFSHDFEFYQTAPRTGYRFTFQNVLVNNTNLNEPNGSLYNLKGTLLYNGGGFSPPLYVLGLRFRYAFVDADDLINVPNRLRLFLGGDRDIRGFGRNSINNNNVGFKSILYVGGEFRMLRVLPYNLQPFLFTDVAKVGLSGLEFSETTFWNPGLGMRWQSPFGSFRATGSYGYIKNPTDVSDGLEEDWTFYFSYGQEF